MAVLQMQRISICALKKNRKAILETVQNLGVMEVNQIIEEDADFHKMDTTNARISFDKAAALADKALEILQIYAPVKAGLFASLAGKPLVDKDTYKNAAANQDKLMKTAARIQALDKERADQKAEILKLENSIESLKPWLSLGVPMNCRGTKSTAMLLGTLPNEWKLEDVYSMLAEKASEAEGVHVHILSARTEGTYVAVFCMKEEEDFVESALRSSGFAKPESVWDDTPENTKLRLMQQIETCNSRIAEIEKGINTLSVNREDLQLLSDYYRIRADKYEVLGQIPQSKRTFIISGYVPAKYISKIKKALSGYNCIIDIEELKEDEEAPVLLKNNGFFEVTEGILESYGLPGKDETDPTTFMTIFYIFLFGLMLSDAAYGALISIACGAVLLKFPRMQEGMKKSLKLFFWCGLSTLFWGVMFGGFFGDLITVVGRVFFDIEIAFPTVWFVPLNDPMRLLIWSMIFGLIHLFAGLALKAYQQIKNKQYLDALYDVGLWYIFLFGLLLLLIPTDIFASILGSKVVFPEVVNTLAKVLAIGGAVGLLLMSGRANKNAALRIALGAYDLYNVTSWLSDLLSYSRLLALGLATGVIANVVNQMGSMMGNGIIGAIGFTVVFIVGHTLNLAINLLGAYVHTNRLQYVEFFGKFYKGGGRKFNPFRVNTKYADIKEEK
ncbi:MAG: V-type ATP synthase subunit I [Schaedlerella sp.]|nr:V-type ATP synthase subunit I [Schaedlerella sp.]